MAIINSFPVGDTALAPIFEVANLFPAMIKNTRTDKTGRVIISGEYIVGDTESDVQEPYIDDITIYPLVTFYIRISLRNNPGQDPQVQRNYTFDPGHAYRIHREYRTPASEQYGTSGEIRLYKDENELLYNQYPTSGIIFQWSLTPFN